MLKNYDFLYIKKIHFLKHQLFKVIDKE